ncbi:glycosyltransferase family 4 protein [Aequorivita marisscotiae]|uniref:Glycosyltransferase family 4 protein n=1 Tax=Aequorivita marisscotiae TaxID=3040348 RepID=A0ABY8KRW9_9FLAO|nr:glycosyltransferase family 4 protein [Aequorivita sp. Ant34-E75]WGF92204.1 glycosyltransferase family 4 protein [Aequorivita sp. Ant34-E75]
MYKTKKILIVHRYYYPDTPAYAVMLKKIAEHLSTEHSVEVLSSMPSYYGASTVGVKRKESLNKINISRIQLLPEKNRNFVIRIINTLLFAINVFFKILFRPKYDLITVATTPPIIIATVIRILSSIKGSKYLYHCQDIYPEIAYYNKNLNSKIFFNVLRFIDKKNNKKASKIVVLSEDMKNTLVKERGIDHSKITIINNFIRTETTNEQYFNYNDYGIKDTDFIVVFCGNLGKLQNLNSIIKLAIKCENYHQIKFVFIGDGVESKNLINQAGNLLNKSIFFLGYLKSEIASKALEQSNIGVVSISEPTYKTAYPSKTMTYLNAGLPILAILNKSSELAKFIIDKKIGFVAAPDDLNEMKRATIEYYEKNENSNQGYIKEIAQQEFGEEVILNKWSKLINSI